MFLDIILNILKPFMFLLIFKPQSLCSLNKMLSKKIKAFIFMFLIWKTKLIFFKYYSSPLKTQGFIVDMRRSKSLLLPSKIKAFMQYVLIFQPPSLYILVKKSAILSNWQQDSIVTEILSDCKYTNFYKDYLKGTHHPLEPPKHYLG